MIVLPRRTIQRVIPQWLSYREALSRHELLPLRREVVRNTEEIERAKQSYLDDIEAFQESPSFNLACDILGSAHVLGMERNSLNASKYILKHSGIPSVVRELALHLETEGRVVRPRELDIKGLKLLLRENPRNAIAWIDRARMHAIVGQWKSANKCIEIALELAPANRFVVRNAVRFYIHIGEYERAFHFANQAARQNHDPWINAVRISSAQIADKKIKPARFDVQKIVSDEQRFAYSEMMASMAMYEMIEGRDRTARKMFAAAWAKPTRNVVSHAEWVLREKYPSMQETATLKMSDSSEALAWQRYFELKTTEALESANKWMMEEPYSRRPFIFASSVYCNEEQYRKAARVATEGLVSNPDCVALQNNRAFSLLMQGGAREIEEAEEAIQKMMRMQKEDMEVITCAATYGLYLMKIGLYESGREQYQLAAALAEKKGLGSLAQKAYLCLAVAEIEQKIQNTYPEDIEKAKEIAKNTNNPDVVLSLRLLEKKLREAE